MLRSEVRPFTPPFPGILRHHPHVVRICLMGRHLLSSEVAIDHGGGLCAVGPF